MAVIKVGCKFADETSRSVSIGEVAPAALDETNVRDIIAILNNPTQREETYPGFTSGFQSTAGANFVSIASAQFVITNRTVIF